MKSMGDEEQLHNFYCELLADNENIEIEAPISLSGEIAYS
jgi:hypothetical protein